MKAILEHERCCLFAGDCAELEQVLPENSIDAMVTDPPAGIGFMSADWDKNKGGRDKWVAWLTAAIASSYRALKPGAYGLVWALPRTSHWTAYALENAGFEIRDVHHHIFGSGMPKSLDMMREIDMHLCELPGRHFDKNLPPVKKRLEGDHLCPEHGERERGAGIRRTGLKPAVEHWILVRKPLDGTYAENALAWGTGGMNVEACRIGTEKVTTHSRGTNGAFPKRTAEASAAESGRHVEQGNVDTETERTGRWPAHLSLDEFAAEELDKQSGIAKPKGKRVGKRDRINPLDGVWPEDPGGGASRFFYVAKPSRTEKDAGLDHLKARTGGEATGREDDSLGTKNPRAGAGRTGGARNFHPTVKSLELMKWLIKLVTPPGGVVLDPFAGSGSTGVAALEQGYGFIGCDLGGDDGEYLPILEGRIRHALGVK